jgi:phospholipase/carboxylesterase
LIVLLHGWGENEGHLLQLADRLPATFSYASVRAPYRRGRHFDRFAADTSFGTTCAWFEAWLDDVASERPVLLVGFSAGAAFAGGATLVNPGRYLGTAMLCGTLPFDAGVPVSPGLLVDVDVFLAHALDDTVIPRELLDQTWTYLTEDSGARCVARRYEGHHEVSPGMVSDLSHWLRQIARRRGR